MRSSACFHGDCVSALALLLLAFRSSGDVDPSMRRLPAVRVFALGIALLIALPFTAPFSTCDLATLVAGPGAGPRPLHLPLSSSADADRSAMHAVAGSTTSRGKLAAWSVQAAGGAAAHVVRASLNQRRPVCLHLRPLSSRPVLRI